MSIDMGGPINRRLRYEGLRLVTQSAGAGSERYGCRYGCGMVPPVAGAAATLNKKPLAREERAQLALVTLPRYPLFASHFITEGLFHLLQLTH